MKTDALLQSVKRILFETWDPIGVNDSEAGRDEYDAYARRIVGYLREGTDAGRLTDYLTGLTRNMGLPRTDEERDRRIAEQLLELVADR